MTSPTLYEPTPYFSDEVNRKIIQSEIEGGVYLRDLRCGALLEIIMADWNCTMLYCGGSEALISGHPRFCPDLVRVQINGSTWGGSMLKQGFIGRGMRLELLHPVHKRIITSVVQEIRVRNLAEVLEPAFSR